MIDSGAAQTSVVPVHDGYALTGATLKTPLAGDFITSKCRCVCVCACVCVCVCLCVCVCVCVCMCMCVCDEWVCVMNGCV